MFRSAHPVARFALQLNELLNFVSSLQVGIINIHSREISKPEKEMSKKNVPVTANAEY